MVKELAKTENLRRGAAPESAWAYFEGGYVPLAEARVSVMTHAFNYGTGCFEGIRAYWNAADSQLYALFLREHYERMLRSCKLLKIQLPHSAAELAEITLEVLRRCGYRSDVYVRPIAYKPDEIIGVRLHDLGNAFTVFAVPFGNYIDIEKGLKVGVSSWRRVDDNAIPARAKITGSYINAAFATTDAHDSGYDEAIVLTQDGHVSEGSAENLFMVRDGRLVTPAGTDNILEGITRGAVLSIARDEGIPIEVRSIDRTELYICEELFLTGTGAQISPVTSVDHRAVGDGVTGPITAKIKDVYFRAVKGMLPRYRSWVTPVF
ncbi:MAG: branched-chain amino acid transaminase [Chloroflexi bacterium]|nr:branched-chain amino acid transaminase [Chloroflexota bacterium]